MRRPRLVATDLDGTLLHSDGTVTPRTREVLRELDALGVPVVFTTGRPIRWMEGLWEAVGGHGLAICSNGAIVYDVERRAIDTAHTLPADSMLEIARLLRRHLPGTSFALEKTTGFGVEPEFVRRHDATIHDLPIDTLEGLVDGSVVKLLAQHEGIAPETYWRRVEELVGHLAQVTWSSTFAMVEMSPTGVTKASALAELATRLEVEAADVIAFGDMPNDLPLLEWAGTSYAMANAHPLVLELADHLAPSHDEDGVAQVLAAVFGLSGEPARSQ
ncbi:haloacid dehalogenase [Nocardioides gansuensis]|uniref:Haloacid dehalogenase n=1 Tax=Nocardioides gansuensis TaxID=2138300 RepID=A0A2T8FA60_9ACTN|nr:haloacid dehalogenase [Nocardioides gansuensis]